MLPLIFAGVTAVAGFTAAWQIQGMRNDAIINEQRAVQAALLAEAHANARRETERLQAAKDKAERMAKDRVAALARDLAANRDALGRLSNAADTALRTANNSHGACLATAVTQGDVLQQCGARLVEVAGHADQHVSDIKTLIDSWPTQEN